MNTYFEKAKEQDGVKQHSSGALLVKTGQYTGRITHARFLVDDPTIHDQVDWGEINVGVSVSYANKAFEAATEYLQKNHNHAENKMSGYVGPVQINVHSTSCWHLAFAYNMFRQQKAFKGKLDKAVPKEINIYHLPLLKSADLNLKEASDPVQIILDIAKSRVLILGSSYAGEIKKSAFSIVNYWLPESAILPMHASANCAEDGSSSCVLFGLSGTGKTTLSADPSRRLIGDDEIVWTATGLSNLEGGCYAKLIHLSEKDEPLIFNAVHQSGSIMENVVCNEQASIDFSDNTHTENTRGSYPVESLNGIYNQSIEAEPAKNIVFLTADAFCSLPALARLSLEQAKYHFVMGYTAKVAGTELGVNEAQAVFSQCFGAPFMPRPADVYAELLVKYAQENNAKIWLLNTGWVEASGGEKKRFPIHVSRSLLSALQKGQLDSVEYEEDPVFKFKIPKSCPGVEEKFLQKVPLEKSQKLAKLFCERFEKLNFQGDKENLKKGGPVL